MKWTREKPTKPGWYWLRGAVSIFIVEVYDRDEDGVLWIREFAKPWRLSEEPGNPEWQPVAPPSEET